MFIILILRLLCSICNSVSSQPCSRITNEFSCEERSDAGHQQVCHHHHFASWPSSAEWDQGELFIWRTTVLDISIIIIHLLYLLLFLSILQQTLEFVRSRWCTHHSKNGNNKQNEDNSFHVVEFSHQFLLQLVLFCEAYWLALVLI